MDHKAFFVELISGLFNQKYTRSEIAQRVSMEIDVDEIKGGKGDLLVNCEMALRHIDHEGYYTTEKELKYYLSCLMNERPFSEKERDAHIQS